MAGSKKERRLSKEPLYLPLGFGICGIVGENLTDFPDITENLSYT